MAASIVDEDAGFCRGSEQHGMTIIEEIGRRKGGDRLSTSSRTAMPDGWPLATTAPRPRRSMPRTTAVWTCTSGLTKRGRGIRAPT